MEKSQAKTSRHSVAYELADRLPRPYDSSALFRGPHVESAKLQSPSEGRHMLDNTESVGCKILPEEAGVATNHHPYAAEDKDSVSKRKSGQKTEAETHIGFELP